MKRFHYDKETGWGYLIKNNDIDGKPTIKIAFKVKKNRERYTCWLKNNTL